VSQSAYSEEIADLLRQADETFRGGDPDSARMIFEAVLQIDPENDAALSGIERASSLASDPPSGGVDLGLDLDLAAVIAPAPPRRPGPASHPAPQPEALVDLLEAAGQLPAEEPLRQTTPPNAAVRATVGEAALLAEQARRHLYQGDLARATELASRALAMNESCEVAQEILEEARAEAVRRAATAERLLSDAITAIERGAAAQAIPMLQQVLGLAPEHPEALEWIARARQLIQAGRAHDAATAETGSTPGSAGAPAGPPRPTLPPPASAAAASRPDAAAPPPPTPTEPHPTGEFGFQSNATPDPVPSSAGRYSAGVAKERVPVDAPLATIAPAKPIRAPIAVAGTTAAEAAGAEATAPSPPITAPPPVPRESTPAVARPLTGRAAKAAKAPRGRRLVVPLTALLTLAALTAGGWWLGGTLGWWGGNSAPPASNAAPAKPKAAKAGPASAPPQLTKADVPRLLLEGKLAVARGDEKAGFALIRQAAQLDPAHAEARILAAKVEHAVASRAEADDRHAQLVRSHDQRDFAEVLRILYRLPKAEQPADFNGVLANASFNLGLQMMRGGDPSGAREYLRDTLERRPGDAETKRLLALAKQYRDRARDDAYFQTLAELQYRPLQ
jgi:hypothetical protein